MEKRNKNLIVTNKIVMGKEAISVDKLFQISMENRTKRHGYKLYKIYSSYLEGALYKLI